MSMKWLPVEGGIVPLSDSSGPAQEAERFAAFEAALEDARGEYRLRRLDRADAILEQVIRTLKHSRAPQDFLMAASAHCLKGRIHWRRAERALEWEKQELAQDERSKQDKEFRQAIVLFEEHLQSISADMPESRLRTDYAIALFRTGEPLATIEKLKEVQQTGVMAGDAFAYLGMAYLELGKAYDKATESIKAEEAWSEAVSALRKGLQLAPGDRVLLETLAVTLKIAGKHDEALRIYCKAAVAAGKDEDLASAQELLKAALEIRRDHAQALCMLSLLLRSQDEDDAAQDLLESTLKEFPENPWALGLQAMIMRDRGNVEGALAYFERAHVDSADLAWISLEHAKTLVASDAPAARKLLNHASKFLGKDDPRVIQTKLELQVQIALTSVANVNERAMRWLRGTAKKAVNSELVRNALDQVAPPLLEHLVEFARKDSEQVDRLREVVDSAQDNVQPREALARALLDKGLFTEAVEAIDAALDIVERDEDRRTLDSARLLGLKAAALEGSGNFSEAVRFYRRASRAAPENDDLFGSFIKTLTKTGRSEEALSEIEQRLLLMPTNGRALLDKGRLRVEAERYEEAIETLQKAEAHIAVDGRWDVCMHLATALLSLHRFREALDALERAAQVDNELVDAHTRMALILIEIAEYDRANQVLGAAIVRIPAETSDENKKERLALLWYVRGWALRCAGSACASELREVFERAVKLTPNEPYAKRLLAWALLHEDDGREKGEGILLALVDERSGVKSGDLAAWCHYMLGQYEAAEHWLRGMVNSDPNDVATRFDLALSLLALKREEGVEEYKAALELARKQARDRQRGILYIAAADLIEASEDRRVKDVQAQTVWESLWTVLKELQRHTEEFATLRNRALATFRARSAA